MKLYNTLTRQIEEINPLEPPVVTVYTCGPTVYDYAHIGHWFNYVRMDTLIRALKANGFQTKWVMNITDVGHLVSDADEGEDKLEKGARREGKTAWEVAEFYTQDFMDGMKLLNMLQPDHIVKATDHITEQIELIQKLETKGFTYVIDDGVYYDTAKFPTYADFARLDLDEQQDGARVAVNQQKHNQSDFALWKFSPTDHQRDMEWDSPWGKGFPGWHIECSAMSMKYLGETLDIHTGGIDHIPVHHTNEIAQSEAATGKKFVNLWFHSNHVTVNGEKISKSLGNGIRLQEIIEKGISPMAVRLHILESHYRSQSKFSWESLEAAQNRLNDLQAMAVLRFQPIKESKMGAIWDFSAQIRNIKANMKQDLSTPRVLGTDLALVGGGVVGSSETQITLMGGVPESEISAFTEYIKTLDAYLGLGLMQIDDINDKQRRMISDRENARETQDWAKSDELRDKLKEQAIGLRDTERGAIWFRL
jgi:cysteinyl-tRNA synthetase